jgi:hypothetical protein
MVISLGFRANIQMGQGTDKNFEVSTLCAAFIGVRQKRYDCSRRAFCGRHWNPRSYLHILFDNLLPTKISSL